MNMLTIKQWLCVLSFTMGIVSFQGCARVSEGGPQYSFIEPVQIVEVDADTKSFRIVVERIKNYDNYGLYVPVDLDTINTTARHNEHFINHIEPPFGSIGDFTAMDSENMFYRDVVLLPEGITSEVSIFYLMGNVNIDLNDRLEVILRAKATN